MESILTAVTKVLEVGKMNVAQGTHLSSSSLYHLLVTKGNGSQLSKVANGVLS